MTEGVPTDETPDDPDTSADAEAGDEAAVADEHLDDLSDGAGCTEIWEYLAERRDEDA